MKKKVTGKQVFAVIAIALLVGMYVVSLVLSLIGNEWAKTMLKISILGTFIIPILIYVIMMFYRLGHRNDAPEPDVYADEKDDPYMQDAEEEAVSEESPASENAAVSENAPVSEEAPNGSK